MTAAPPPWPPGRPGPFDGRGRTGDTGERLRAALSARSAQVGPEISTAEGFGGTGSPSPPPYGPPPGYGDRIGHTSRLGDPPVSRAGDGRAGFGGSGGSSGSGGPPGPGGRRPLLPLWAKAALGVALVLSATLGVVLGLRPADDADGSAALPPPRETSYDSDRARVAITSFVRSGRFVTLELELTNLAPLGSDDTWSVSNSFGTSSNYDLSGIRLLDPAAGTSIRPAEDADGDCICSDTTGLSIVAGSSTRVSAQFPAPAPEVKTLNIDIPGAGSFRDVRLA